jgi:hypothetical protein
MERKLREDREVFCMISRTSLAAWLVISALAMTGDSNLPQGQNVLDSVVDAEGGRAAFDRLHTRALRGQIEVPGKGLSGPIAIYQAAPGKERSEMFGGVEGTDGEIAWENVVTGPRAKQGAERRSVLRRAVFNPDANWRKVYQSADCQGVENANGVECYRVQLKTFEGEPVTLWIDKKSHMPVKEMSTEHRPDGDYPLEISYEDYRKVDGIWFPYRQRHKIAGTEMVVTFDRVEHNALIPSAQFEPPAAVKKLLEKEKERGK